MPARLNSIDRESLPGLEASVHALRGDLAMAMRVLAGAEDPSSFNRRLAVLIELEDFEAAADALQGKPLHEFWVSRAVFVLAVVGRVDDALSGFAWAAENTEESVVYRTAVATYDGILLKLTRDRVLPLAPGNLGLHETALLKSLSKSLMRPAERIATQSKAQSELESQLLQRAVDCSYLLGDRRTAGQFLDSLRKRTPLPLRVGHAILQGLYPHFPNAVDRLWNEHPSSFDARLLACVVLSRFQKDPDGADLRARTLVPFATTTGQKEDLCEFLYELQITRELPPDFAEFEQLVLQLVGRDSTIFKQIEADHLTRKGDAAEALRILETIRDDTDPRWLRGFANAKARLGDDTEALYAFQRLSAIFPHQDVFQAVVGLSSKQGLVKDEKGALEAALELDPTNTLARKRLANLLASTHEYLQAAKHLEVLKDLQHDDAIVANLAVSYALGGQTDRALQVLVPADGETLPLQLLTLRAQLLKSAGKQEQAFEEIAHGRPRHWESPEFVMSYMTIGYATGNEREASEALTQLISLQKAGRVDPHLMHAVSIDDIGDMIAKEEKRQSDIRGLLLRGQIPWVSAARLQGDVPLWSWLLKTQNLPWVFDEPTNRAHYGVYATNGFRVAQLADNEVALEEIVCSQPGSAVVIDLSALITLHQLGLVSEAAKYFGRIHIPAAYVTSQPSDNVKLVPHQQSSKDVALETVRLHNSDRISVLTSIADSGASLRLIDEYDDQADSQIAAFSLIDVIELLYSNGHLSDEQRATALLASSRPSAIRDGGPQLRLGDKVLVSTLTLDTIHRIGLFRLFVELFAVNLSTDTYSEFVARKNAFELLEQARNSYERLWRVLRSDDRFVFTPSGSRPSVNSKTDSPPADTLPIALSLAQELHLPLFADDRVLQAIATNTAPERADAAFGTDSFVQALANAKHIDARRVSDCLRQLIAWRYKFVQIPPYVLKVFADDHKEHPPGVELRRVATYVHDCMRDPGLFTGLEATKVPASMAVRLFLSWVYCVAEFVVDVWIDSSNSSNHADAITEWALTELLPSPPKYIDDAAQARLSSLIPHALLSRTLIRAAGISNADRVNLAIRSITRNLGITERQYVDTLIRVTDVAIH